HLHRRAVLGMDHPTADQIPDLVGGKLCAGEHGAYPRHPGGFRRVDRIEPRMRVRRAHEISVGLARPADVVGVVAFAGDETLILLAAHWGADPGRAHGLSSLETAIFWSMIF